MGWPDRHFAGLTGHSTGAVRHPPKGGDAIALWQFCNAEKKNAGPEGPAS
jgi:hypothetical protein